MTDIYKLTDGTSSLDISPIRGENVPENRRRQIIDTKTGMQTAYEWGGVYQTEIVITLLLVPSLYVILEDIDKLIGGKKPVAADDQAELAAGT